MTKKSCILLFSGGRDSSLAAVRAGKIYEQIILVTVTTPHLRGIEVVHSRIRELKRFLPYGSKWLNLKVNMNPSEHFQTLLQTCLPCHLVYISSAVALGKKYGITDISIGYSGYQSTWPEQTPYAINRLSRFLLGNGFVLILPVRDLKTKEEAIDQLNSCGLSDVSLEQKCLQNESNVNLNVQQLHSEIDSWIDSLAVLLLKPHDFAIVEEIDL